MINAHDEFSSEISEGTCNSLFETVISESKKKSEILINKDGS